MDAGARLSIGSVVSGKTVYHDANSAYAPGSSRAASKEDDIFGIDEDLPPMPVPYALPPLASTSAASTFGLTPVQPPSSAPFAPQPTTHAHFAMVDIITPPITPPQHFPGPSYKSPFGTPTKTSKLPYPTLVATPYKRSGLPSQGEVSTIPYPQATKAVSPGAWLRSGHATRPSAGGEQTLDDLLDLPPPTGAARSPDLRSVARWSADDALREAAERQQVAGHSRHASYSFPGLGSWTRRNEDQPPETEQDIGEMGQERDVDLEAAPPSAQPGWKGIRVEFPTPEVPRLRPNFGSETNAERDARRMTFGQVRNCFILPNVMLTFAQSTFFDAGPSQYLDLPDMRPLSPQTGTSQPSSAGSRQSMFSTYSSHPNPSHRAPSLTALGVASSPAFVAARLGATAPVPPLPSSSRLYPPPLPLPPNLAHRRVESLPSAGNPTLSPSSTEDHSRISSTGEPNWTRPTSLESTAGPSTPRDSQGNRGTWNATDFSLVAQPWTPPGILEDLRHTAVAASLPSPLTFSATEGSRFARGDEDRNAQYLTARSKVSSDSADEEGRQLTQQRTSTTTTSGRAWDDVMRLLQD